MLLGSKAKLESVGGGSAALVLARLLTLPIGLLSTGVISRYLGVSLYGNYTYVLAFWAIFNMVSEMYVTPVVTTEMAKPDADVRATWYAGVIVQLGYTVAAGVVGLIVGALFFWTSPGITSGMLVGVLLLVSSIPVLNAPLQLRSRMWIPALLGVMQSSLMLALFAICSRLGARWQAFVGANAVAGIITLIALAVLARRQLPPSASELSNKRLMGTARTVAAASFGLGLASILSAVYYKVDALLVFRLAGSVQAGLYGAAYRFYELALIVPTAVNLSALAGAARRIHGGDDDARPYVSAVFVALLVAGVGGAVLFLLAGRPLVELVFGSEFTAAVPMLQVLAFGLLARFVHVWLGSILIAVERRKRFTAVVAVTAVVAIVADLIAIPRFGGLGAAWVTVAVETLMVVGTLLMLPEDLRPHVHRGVRYLGRAIGWTR